MSTLPDSASTTSSEPRVHVFIDFDGTIARNDVGNEFFRAHNAFEPAHTDLVTGKISVPEFYRRACAAIPSSLSAESLSQFAAGQELDSGFASLVHWCRNHAIDITIVSDGFTSYIEPMLDHIGVRDVPVFANVLDPSTLRPSFPNASEACTCYCASCKRNVVITNAAPDDILVYIGDGLSDTCAASHCDVIFAKSELAAFCSAERIPHHPWKHLSDVERILEQYRRQHSFRPRRQAVLARKRAIEAE
jgi:2-hydroxy-3-keto-5-methylthiopentenyl-1-phosphate phosphatase